MSRVRLVLKLSEEQMSVVAAISAAVQLSPQEYAKNALLLHLQGILKQIEESQPELAAAAAAEATKTEVSDENR